MDINELKSQIMNKTSGKFYIFTGPEWKIQQIYIKKMEEAFNKSFQYIDSISSIYSKLSNRSFLNRSYLYVVRDDPDLQTNESLQDKITKILGDNILILLLTNVDKRTKFYKKYSGSICTFEYLTPIMLSRYIKKEIDLPDTDISKLIEICENDYGRCLLEIDKIKRSNKPFKRLVQEGTIYTPPKDAVFELVDAILDGESSCFDLYEDCKAVNEATMVILSVLYNNAKAVLQVQSYTGNDIGKVTGLNGYQINNARNHLHKRKNSDLIYIMRLCQQCQEGIVTGKIEEEFVIDYILGEIM